MSMARAARDFFKDFDVLAPEISTFFSGPQGPGGIGGGGVAHNHCNFWNNCCLWIATAIVGTLCSTNSESLRCYRVTDACYGHRYLRMGARRYKRCNGCLIRCLPCLVPFCVRVERDVLPLGHSAGIGCRANREGSAGRAVAYATTW